MIRFPVPLMPWSIALAALYLCQSPIGRCDSDAPVVNPVQRVTTDRDGDLFDAMIRDGLLEMADQMCDAALASGDPRSDDFARWTIRLTKVRVQRQLSSDDFNDANVQAASKPIADLIQQYPDHLRALFLRAAKLEIDAAAARHDVVFAAVQPSGSEREHRALRRITTLSDEASELMTEIRSARSVEESVGKKAADLIRLQQEIQVLLVSTHLLQTELFAPGSRDFVSAATTAITTADQAIAQLPDDSLARHEIERIRVHAILRSGDHGRARKELDALEHFDATAPMVRALEVQIDLASGQLDLAKKRLDQYYGASPMDAPKSVELDLIRFDYLIASESPEVSSWLDAIRRRSGEYARRRAEALSLQRLRSGQSTATLNPSLVAAQGQDWLRRGEPQRAVELISAAAIAENDHDQALRYARDAAAILVSINRSSDAADLLAQLSIAKPEATDAPKLQLQAAFLYSTLGDSAIEIAEHTEGFLRKTIELWPNSDSANQARTWLVKILLSQHRLVEAAEAAMPNSLEKTTPLARSDRLQLWKNAIHSASPESRPEAYRRLKDSFKLKPNDTSGIEEFRTVAALLLDRDQLIELATPQHPTTNPDQDAIEALLRFRLSEDMTYSLPQPPEEFIGDVIWRLMQDAKQDSRRQLTTARVINDWAIANADSIDCALRLLWLNDVTASMSMLRRLIAQSETPGLEQRNAARCLASSDNAEAKSAAVTMWDELASGLPKGDPRWHEAKLSVIALLRDMNQNDEAVRRAKYILLTSPPTDPEIKRQYERYSQ